MARIIVSGYMVRHPLAGNLMAYFHYVYGLWLLGHDVFYLEESGWPSSCYNPGTHAYGDDPSAGLQAVQTLMAECGIDVPVCYVDRGSGAVFGTAWDDAKRSLGAADLLLNLGGTCWLPEFRLCHRRALIDMDPLFTQAGLFTMAPLDEYHALFSYGANIGRPGCTIPTAGVDWLPLAPPVVPELWQRRPSVISAREETAAPANDAFTTVANWHAYGGITHRSEHYGQKDEEFLRLVDLPRHTAQRLELALSGIDAAASERLRAAGWSIRNGGDVSKDFPAYQAYIVGSRGEFSVAKHAYVKTHSGWFSDRSVCYLAAGLPVIVQDTGFSDWLPVGCGVLPFHSLAEAVECIEQVNADYLTHRQAARDIAVRTFSHSAVLSGLLDTAMR